MVRQVETEMQGASILAPQQISQRTISLLERQMDDLSVGKPACITLVMGQVQIIDSVGLTWLINAQSRLASQGIQFMLQDPTPLIQDVLLATRLDGRFRIGYSANEGVRHG